MANVIVLSNATQISNFLFAIRRGEPVTQTSGGTQGEVTVDVGRTVATHTAASTVFSGQGRNAITDLPEYYFSLVNGGTAWKETVSEDEIRVVSWPSKDAVGLGICSGTCKDDAASALNDATVTITKGAFSKSATSAAGAYSIADIPADTGYTLTVSKTGYTSASYTVEITEAATTTQNVVAPRDGSMSGTVTDETGNVEGATVNLCAIDTTTPVLFTGTTIADGTYAIASVDVGTYDVWFSKENHVSAKTDDQAVVANTDKVVNKVLGEYANYSGKCTAAAGGGDLVGVVVALYAEYPGTPAYTATSAADGTYAITNIVPGTYQLRVSKATFVTQFTPDLATLIADADITNANFAMVAA